MLVGGIYRSDSGSAENNLKLNELLREISGLSTHLLVAGDFNYKEINWDTWSTPSEDLQNNQNLFIECLRDNYLFQHVRKPTRPRVDKRDPDDEVAVGLGVGLSLT